MWIVDRDVEADSKTTPSGTPRNGRPGQLDAFSVKDQTGGEVAVLPSFSRNPTVCGEPQESHLLSVPIACSWRSFMRLILML
jgi:hypothetical protein